MLGHTQPSRQRTDGVAASVLRGEVHADYLFVVPGIDATVGKGGMGPKHRASGGIAGRREQVRAADLLVAAGAELRDDQIPLLVEEEEAVPVLHDEGIGPADGLTGGRGHERFPNALSGEPVRWANAF